MDLRSALELGHDLMVEHGVDGWQIGLDRAKTRAGATRWATREITLSAHLTLLHDDAEVRDTILHEIAHVIAGPKAGHGPRWRAAARSIGCSAQRCLDADAPVVQGDWVGRCPAGHMVTRHRTPTRVVSCTRCGRGFSPDHLLDWTFRGEPVPMHPNYVAELATLRARPQPVAVAPGGGRVRIGTRVRVTAPGRYADVVGTVAKRGRTRWHVKVPGGVLTVPFSLVEPVPPAPREVQVVPVSAGQPVADTLFDL